MYPTPNGNSSSPTSACCPRTPASASIIFATSSTACGKQSRRWLAAGCFEAIIHDLRAILRFAAGRDPEPTATIFDGRTMQSTPESGGRAGYDGYKRRKGSKIHMAVDMLGHLLALQVTPADEQERDQVAVLAKAV